MWRVVEGECATVESGDGEGMRGLPCFGAGLGDGMDLELPRRTPRNPRNPQTRLAVEGVVWTGKGPELVGRAGGSGRDTCDCCDPTEEGLRSLVSGTGIRLGGPPRMPPSCDKPSLGVAK